MSCHFLNSWTASSFLDLQEKFFVIYYPLFILDFLKRAVAGVLDEPFSQLNPLSELAEHARQSRHAGIVSVLLSLHGWPA
jgi:hypothetical protein